MTYEWTTVLLKPWSKLRINQRLSAGSETFTPVHRMGKAVWALSCRLSDADSLGQLLLQTVVFRARWDVCLREPRVFQQQWKKKIKQTFFSTVQHRWTLCFGQFFHGGWSSCPSLQRLCLRLPAFVIVPAEMRVGSWRRKATSHHACFLLSAVTRAHSLQLLVWY